MSAATMQFDFVTGGVRAAEAPSVSGAPLRRTRSLTGIALGRREWGISPRALVRAVPE
jgi:hypothetical protein